MVSSYEGLNISWISLKKNGNSPGIAQFNFASSVLFTYSGNTRVNGFTTIHIYHSSFTEKEINIVSNFVTSHKIWLVQHVRIILDGTFISIFSSTSILIKNISTKNYCISFSEFSIGTRIQGWMASRISS